MVQTSTKATTRVRRPANISKMTAQQKRELVKKAIEMAQAGDFSGVAAMAHLEQVTQTSKSSGKK